MHGADVGDCVRGEGEGPAGVTEGANRGPRRILRHGAEDAADVVRFPEVRAAAVLRAILVEEAR